MYNCIIFSFIFIENFKEGNRGNDLKIVLSVRNNLG